jgi:hypothetical protein
MWKVMLLVFGLVVVGFQPAVAQEPMKFFVASAAGPDASGPDGIRAADEYCAILGYGAGYSDYDWRAFLDAPATDDQPAVAAETRIGTGPWFNYEGILVARTAEELTNGTHGINRRTALNEKGFTPYSRADSPDPAEVLKSKKPDTNGIYFCFAR